MNHLGGLLLTVLCLLGAGARSKAAEPSRPAIVAHRGLALHAPENTLSNFRACLELRLGFEFDVQRTSDGQLVCLHDSTLDRTTDGAGRVAELTLAKIRQYDAGGWFDPKFAGEKVPTIAEVFTLVSEYRQQEVLIAVDLKADCAADTVRMAEKHGVVDRLLFIGRAIFEPSVRRTIRSACPKAQVAIVANTSAEFPQAIADSDANWVYVRYLPPQDEIAAARRRGKRVFIAGPTMTGHVPANWRQATDLGVDAILTDYPLELRSVFRSK